MASWKEERDRLVAQTLAFVQQVAATHPAAASKLGLASDPAPAGDAIIVRSPISDVIAPAPDATDTAIADSAGPGDAVVNSDIGSVATVGNIVADLSERQPQYAKASERSDIAQRVAAFKARQTSLNREREAYYNSVQERIRSSLRNDPGSDRL